MTTLHSSWSGIAGLTVEVDETHSVLLVRRDIEGRETTIYTVVNATAFAVALFSAVDFRNQIEADLRAAQTTGHDEATRPAASTGESAG